MSQAELAGLMLTVALFAAAIGAAFGVVLARQRSARADGCRSLREAYSRWLAARWALNRASVSFVAAFRALAAERPDSPNHALREQEAQRVRARWCQAMDELDNAEAAICVLENDRPAAGMPRPDADELRVVIHGDAAAFESFRERLRREDSLAEEHVRAMLMAQARGPSWFRLAVRGVTSFLQRIVDQWAR